MQIELVPTSEPAAPPQSADSTDPGAVPVNVVPSADAKEVLLGAGDVGGGWRVCHVLSPEVERRT